MPCKTGYLVASVAALDFRPARRATCRAQPPKVREDAAVDSEIAAGRIALFTPHLRVALVSVALALRRGRQCGLSRPTTGLSPAFARHPALCSSDFPLPLPGQRSLGATRSCPISVSCMFMLLLTLCVPRRKRQALASRLGSKDSNLNLRIQSAMFYH